MIRPGILKLMREIADDRGEWLCGRARLLDEHVGKGSGETGNEEEEAFHEGVESP